MIKTNYFFDDIHEITCAWVMDVEHDDVELARIVDMVVENNMKKISLPVGLVQKIWPWTEDKNIEILGRFVFVKDSNDDSVMSSLVEGIMEGFHNGLSGAQVFVNLSDLEDFVQDILPVRDDLFFRRHFSVAINIDDKVAPDWSVASKALKELRVDSLLIVAHGDVFNTKSDFVGRVFDMLNNWSADCELHMMFDNNMMRVSQVLRLVRKIQPNLVPKLRVFRLMQ